ncbi:hypothetical protein D9M68_486280 [compost metagenome]
MSRSPSWPGLTPCRFTCAATTRSPRTCSSCCMVPASPCSSASRARWASGPTQFRSMRSATSAWHRRKAPCPCPGTSFTGTTSCTSISRARNGSISPGSTGWHPDWPASTAARPRSWSCWPGRRGCSRARSMRASSRCSAHRWSTCSRCAPTGWKSMPGTPSFTSCLTGAGRSTTRSFRCRTCPGRFPSAARRWRSGPSSPR